MDNFREWLSDNLRYFLLEFFIIIVLLLLFFGIRFVSSKVASETDTQTESSAGEGADGDGTKATSTVSPSVTGQAETNLEESTDTDLTDLIEKYYKALSEKDISTIKELVDQLDTDEEEQITEDQNLDSYDNVKVYSLPGEEDGSTVVYAVFTYRLKDIDADVPALSQLYVKTDSSGKLYIATGEQDSTVQTYLDECNSREDVKNLIQEVQTNYDTVLSQNEELQEFVNASDTSDSTSDTSDSTSDTTEN